VDKIAALALAALMVVLMALPASAADRDGDGLRDRFEARYGVTSPDSPDSDGDGVVDSAEDSDGDGLSELGEQRFGWHPGRRDSDGDGRSDGREDSDRDGRSDALEQDSRPLPKGLRPTLKAAQLDVPAQREGCQTDHGSAALTMCEFGAPGGPTVVLIGDSHAMMYMPALAPIAAEQGWRLLTLIKSACPPILGVHNADQRRRDAGRSCLEWRRGVLTWLWANQPAHIILAHSYGYKLVSARGEAIAEKRRAAVWKQGLRRTLSALPDASRAVVLGDVPGNAANPLICLRQHKRDMSACTTRREPPKARQIEAALRQAAANKGARFRTLYGKICSYDPCPVVHGDVLLWRDGGHLTATFVATLVPSLRTLLGNALAARPARRPERR